jgi:hypothetical protein
LGEFSPFGRLFTLGILTKNTEEDKIVGLLFSSLCKSYVIILTKMDRASFWAIFFKKSSGHPGPGTKNFTRVVNVVYLRMKFYPI